MPERREGSDAPFHELVCDHRPAWNDGQSCNQGCAFAPFADTGSSEHAGCAEPAVIGLLATPKAKAPRRNSPGGIVRESPALAVKARGGL